MGIYNTTLTEQSNRGPGSSSSDDIKASFPLSPLYKANNGDSEDVALANQVGKAVTTGDSVDSVNKFFFLNSMQGIITENTQFGPVNLDYVGGLPLGSIGLTTPASTTDPAGPFVPNVRVGVDPMSAIDAENAYKVSPNPQDGKSGVQATDRGVAESSGQQAGKRLGDYLMGSY